MAERLPWIKMGILFLFFNLFVWVFKFTEIPFFWRVAFTVAIGIGIYSKFALGINLRERR